MLPWIAFIPEEFVEDDLPDNFMTVPRFWGAGTSSNGEVGAGVNDVDTVRFFFNSVEIAEGTVLSAHGEDNADYKNISGKNAIAVIILEGRNSGAATRHIKIYSGPTTDSITGATKVFETGQTDGGYFDAANDLLTLPPVKIQNNHFIIVENVDDSRAGTNAVGLIGTNSLNTVTSFVVERGA